MEKLRPKCLPNYCNLEIRQKAAYFIEPILSNIEAENNIADRSSCDRESDNGQEVVTNLRYSNTWEGWFDGRPEFRLNYWLGTFTGIVIDPLKVTVQPSKLWYCYQTTNVTYNVDRYGTFFIDSPLFQWNNNGQTNFANQDYYMHWFEDDGGFKTLSLNIGLKHTVKAGGKIPGTEITVNQDTELSSSISSSSVSGNEDLGGAYVNFCDNWTASPDPFENANGYKYGTGSFFFWIKERSY